MSLFANHWPQGNALGATVMTATTFVLAFGDALVKLVSSDFSLWQIFVLRSLLAIPLIVGGLLLTGPPARMIPKSLGWTAVRCLLLMGMWLAFYAALPVLSLAVVAAAYYTAPLFITLFSATLLREPVGFRRWCAIVTGFAGVIVILRPGTEAFSCFMVLPILSAVLFALSAIVTRKKCIDEKPLVLSLALNICFMICGVIASIAVAWWGPSVPAESVHPFFLSPWAELGPRQWAVAALLAVIVVVSSTGVAKAYQSGAPSLVATFDYTYLVFAGLWGYILFSEVPGPATLLGMLLITASGLVVLSRSH